MKTCYSVVKYKKGSRNPISCWTRFANTEKELIKNLLIEGIDILNNKEFYFEIEDGKPKKKF